MSTICAVRPIVSHDKQALGSHLPRLVDRTEDRRQTSQIRLRVMCSVDEQQAVFQSDPLTGQANDSLDVPAGTGSSRHRDHHYPASGRRAPPPRRQNHVAVTE